MLSAERIDIRLAGAGGQGMVLAGRILAEAALLSGKSAIHTQVYGPESRGGASRSDVVISDGEIVFPLAETLDVLVAVTREAFEQYEADLAPDGVLILDLAVPDAAPDQGQRLPIVSTARQVAGAAVTTGVVALGALNGVVGIIDGAVLEQAVAARVPSHQRDLNLQALAAGAQIMGEA